MDCPTIGGVVPKGTTSASGGLVPPSRRMNNASRDSTHASKQPTENLPHGLSASLRKGGKQQAITSYSGRFDHRPSTIPSTPKGSNTMTENTPPILVEMMLPLMKRYLSSAEIQKLTPQKAMELVEARKTRDKAISSQAESEGILARRYPKTAVGKHPNNCKGRYKYTSKQGRKRRGNNTPQKSDEFAKMLAYLVTPQKEDS